MPLVDTTTLKRAADELLVNSTYVAVTSELASKIEELISGVLVELGEKVFGLRPGQARQWVYGDDHQPGEAMTLSYLIASTLIRVPDNGQPACDCWNRWDDFGIQSEVDARNRCRNQHSLAGWHGPNLKRWLYRVVLSGSFERANGLRKGMLAPAVTGPDVPHQLKVAFVLVCSDCRSEIDRKNACQCDPKASNGRQPQWRVFIKGKRHLSPCWRCGGTCGRRIFFRFGTNSRCPACGNVMWMPRPIRVWTPLSTLPLSEYEEETLTLGENAWEDHTDKDDAEEDDADRGDVDNPAPPHE